MTEQLYMQNEDLAAQLVRLEAKYHELATKPALKMVPLTSQRDPRNYETQILDFYQKHSKKDSKLLLTNRVPSNDQLTGRIK